MDLSQIANLSHVQAYKLGYKEGIVVGVIFAAGVTTLTKTARWVLCERFNIERKIIYLKK
jgi:hypothetical protein